MIEVFKTDVVQHTQAAIVLEVLSWHYPLYKLSFDLDDCDCILRIEGAHIAPARVIELLLANGHKCEALV